MQVCISEREGNQCKISNNIRYFLNLFFSLGQWSFSLLFLALSLLPLLYASCDKLACKTCDLNCRTNESPEMLWTTKKLKKRSHGNGRTRTRVNFSLHVCVNKSNNNILKKKDRVLFHRLKWCSLPAEKLKKENKI